VEAFYCRFRYTEMIGFDWIGLIEI